MERYIPLKSRSLKLADEYYDCLTSSLTARDKRSIEDCLRIGRRYRTALQSQRKDLGRLSNPSFVERERQLIDKYLELIDHDLTTLTKGEIANVLARRNRPNSDS